MFIKPQLFKAQVKDKIQLSPKTIELVLALVQPWEIAFIPGQFVNLKVNDSKYRSYSIASNPHEHRTIKLAIDIAHEGLGSNYARSLKLSDEVTFIGPSGRFLLVEPFNKNLVFIATGTGIAPFISMFHALEHQKPNANVFLYFGIRNADEALYLDYLNECVNNIPNFDYQICISKNGRLPKSVSGRVTQHVQIPDTKKTDVYLCGNPKMITEITESLIKQGLSAENLFFERFTFSAN
ncbi:MAG: ferredoxin--NADP reductase [Patescibacteria group bacterium]